MQCSWIARTEYTRLPTWSDRSTIKGGSSPSQGPTLFNQVRSVHRFSYKQVHHVLAKSLRLNTQASLLDKKGLSESCSCLTVLTCTEAIFVSAHSPQVCAKNIAEIRQLAREQFGRNPSNLKVLALVTPILGRTEGEAVAKLKDYRQYASHEGALALFAGWVSIFWTQFEALKRKDPLRSAACVLKHLMCCWFRNRFWPILCCGLSSYLFGALPLVL